MDKAGIDRTDQSLGEYTETYMKNHEGASYEDALRSARDGDPADPNCRNDTPDWATKKRARDILRNGGTISYLHDADEDGRWDVTSRCYSPNSRTDSSHSRTNTDYGRDGLGAADEDGNISDRSLSERTTTNRDGSRTTRRSYRETEGGHTTKSGSSRDRNYSQRDRQNGVRGSESSCPVSRQRGDGDNRWEPVSERAVPRDLRQFQRDRQEAAKGSTTQWYKNDHNEYMCVVDRGDNNNPDEVWLFHEKSNGRGAWSGTRITEGEGVSDQRGTTVTNYEFRTGPNDDDGRTHRAKETPCGRLDRDTKFVMPSGAEVKVGTYDIKRRDREIGGLDFDMKGPGDSPFTRPEHGYRYYDEGDRPRTINVDDISEERGRRNRAGRDRIDTSKRRRRKD
jgi:hypothetical protein